MRQEEVYQLADMILTELKQFELVEAASTTGVCNATSVLCSLSSCYVMAVQFAAGTG